MRAHSNTPGWWVARLGIWVAVVWLTAGTAAAFPVGERHLIAEEPSAAIRDAHNSTQLRVTLWYPAAADANEQPLDIGPPGKPLFKPGAAALDAAFADTRPRAVVLLSHGFGGTARIMAWFGTALARAGYVVIAVDHPGNNGLDPMTVAGAVMFWERPGDLAAALAYARADPSIAPHLDATRLGVAGFSAGGFTSLATIGGRVDVARLVAFCEAHPDDGVCRPQREFAVDPTQTRTFLARPDMAAQIVRSHKDLSLLGVKAAFVMSPAIVQSFTPESLKRIAVPVAVVLGDADTVAPPLTNGEVAASLIPGSQIQILPGVGHYDFLSDCTPDGDTYVPVCPTRLPRDPTHQVAINNALALFGRTIGPP